MSLNRSGVFPNGNGIWVRQVLESVRRLREAYRANINKSDEAKTELVSMLGAPLIEEALNAELKMRVIRTDAPALFSDAVISAETALAKAFGYSPRDVKRYVRRAQVVLGATPTLPDIGDAAELARRVEEIHVAITSAVSASGGGWVWSRAVAKRRARAEALDRLFSVGAIVGNTARRPLFDASYALAVANLSQNGEA